MARKLKIYKHPKYDHSEIVIKVDKDHGTFTAAYEDKRWSHDNLKELEKEITDYINETNNEVYTPVIMIQIDGVPSDIKWRTPDKWREGYISFSMKLGREFIVKRGGRWQHVTMWKTPFQRRQDEKRLDIDNKPPAYYFDNPEETPEKAYSVGNLDWGYIKNDNKISDLPLRNFRFQHRGGTAHTVCIMMNYDPVLWERLKDFESKFKEFIYILYGLLAPIGDDNQLEIGEFFLNTGLSLLPGVVEDDAGEE